MQRYWTLVLVGVASLAFAMPAGARLRHSSSGRISFYSDLGNVINSPYRRNPLVTRPSTLLLAEDGSIALINLQWSGWGSSIARATGVRSASDCVPNCAAGKRATSRARLTLSHPGVVLGHRVYRCFELTIPSHPRLDRRECIRRHGSFYGYTPVSTPGPPARASAGD